MKEIKPDNPDNVEATFAVIRPKAKEAACVIFIVCAMYSPPKSKKRKLLDFVKKNYNILKVKYPSAFLITGGDINELNIQEILSMKENLKQIVTKPTRKKKILSVIITDLHGTYFTE